MFRYFLFIILCVTCCVIHHSAASCTLKFNRAKPGLFVTKSGRNTVVLNPINGTISFTNTSIIDAYCTTGFKNYATTTKLEYQLKYSCSGTTVRYQLPGSFITYLARNDGTLLCDSETQYYSQVVPYCKNTGLAYGFNVGNVSVAFANLCYDFKKQRADFIHYVPGVRNDLVEDQNIFNPGNSSNALTHNRTYPVNGTFFLKEKQTLPSAINLTAGYYNKVMNYEMNDLIPIKLQADVMRPYVSSFENTDSIAWWGNLIDYNWAQVQSQISKLAYSGQYDVYAGTSDDLVVPFPNVNVTLSYKVDQVNRTIPLYVWNLVKSQTDKKDAGVVIIGVNTPFFLGETSKTVICKDMCDKITWMSPLKNTRKISALGYVFCCTTAEVKKRLEGFPQF